MEYRQRHLERKLASLRRAVPVILVLGARQAGKSTLLSHIAPEASRVVFDPVIDIGNARQDPELFLDQYPPPVILDEIQYVPDLLAVIKRRADEDCRPGQYLLTGSQNPMLLESVSESMAGRAAVLDLHFLSLAERCRRADTEHGWIEDLFEADAVARLVRRERLPLRDIEPTLSARLWRGGFPGHLDHDDELLPDLFSSYMRTYVERDVRRVAAVADAGLFARFVGLCAAHSAQEINHSQLGRELGITYHTAQRWLGILRATFQWLEIPPFSNNPAKRVSRRSRGYFTDTGFAAWTQRISSPAALMSNPVQGALFETHVVLDILKQTRAMRYPPRLHHWRQHSGAEVDLVLERDGVLVAVEAKSGARVSRGDTRGIRAFRENHPRQRHGIGVVVAAVNAPMQLGDDIVALPYDIA
ncbi:MAG: ATP-binding protein [Thiotrichales bacterium]|nr:ATP-binding protein [Thiotrichales bacterium]